MHPRHLNIAVVLGRFALFVVYFWFGALKILDLSPANPLVAALLERTIPFITFPTFIFYFAIFEMIIGILFLVPRLEKLSFWLFIAHMLMTFMPLVMLPAVTWQGFLTPTLEGQYIIKNMVLIALAFFVYVTTDVTESNRKARSIV